MLESGHRVRAVRSFQALGEIIQEGQQGQIILKYQLGGIFSPWTYQIVWDDTALMVPAHEDEIERIKRES